jgi:hypothetical protein
MVFKGIGIVWNPKRNKLLCNFKKGQTYETQNLDEIEVLQNCPQAEYVSGDMPEVKEEVKEAPEPKEPKEPKEPTKNEIMALLDEKEIGYNPRDKKEVLAALLEVD